MTVQKSLFTTDTHCASNLMAIFWGGLYHLPANNWRQTSCRCRCSRSRNCQSLWGQWCQVKYILTHIRWRCHTFSPGSRSGTDSSWGRGSCGRSRGCWGCITGRAWKICAVKKGSNLQFTSEIFTILWNFHDFCKQNFKYLLNKELVSELELLLSLVPVELPNLFLLYRITLKTSTLSDSRTESVDTWSWSASSSPTGVTLEGLPRPGGS